MISASFNKTLQADYASLNFGTAGAIIQQIDLIYSLLIKAYIPARPYTPKSVQILLGMDEEAKLKILGQLQNWSAILMSAESALDNVDERTLAIKALNYFNFRLKDHSWEDTHHDEIIELYNPQGIQLYRSLNFFKTCGYSLLDLCVNEWFVLWERPRSVVDKMFAISKEILSGSRTNYSFNVGPHLVRETYDDGTTQPFLPRAAIVEFKNIYPAYSADQKEIIGFVCTSKGSLISTGEEALKVSFI